jgi:hypothetical protein
VVPEIYPPLVLEVKVGDWTISWGVIDQAREFFVIFGLGDWTTGRIHHSWLDNALISFRRHISK